VFVWLYGFVPGVMSALAMISALIADLLILRPVATFLTKITRYFALRQSSRSPAE